MEKPKMNRYPIRNTGSENDSTASAISARSIHVPAFHAAMMPIGTAKTTAKVIVRKVSHSVGSMRWPIIRVTGSPVNTDTPMSPCSSRHSHEKNCSYSGRFRPSSWRTRSTSSELAVSPAISAAGSPGLRCSSRNTITATMPRTGMTARMRFKT